MCVCVCNFTPGRQLSLTHIYSVPTWPMATIAPEVQRKKKTPDMMASQAQHLEEHATGQIIPTKLGKDRGVWKYGGDIGI